MGQSRLHGAGESDGSACNRGAECSSGGVGRKKHRQVRVSNEGQEKKIQQRFKYKLFGCTSGQSPLVATTCSGSPLVAFCLAGHKNRLQIFPVPGEIHKPPRVDDCCRVDKMPFTSSEQENDQEEGRTRWWTKNYVGADA